MRNEYVMSGEETRNSSFPTKWILVTDNPGRLGNLITRHAHLLAFAIEHGYGLVDYSFLDNARHLPCITHSYLYGVPYIPSGMHMQYLARTFFRLFREMQRMITGTDGFREVSHMSTLGKLVYVEHTCYPQFVELDGAEFKARTGQARVLLLAGYVYRADELFRKHAKAIRLQCTVSKEASEDGDKYFVQPKGFQGEVVGIHIRHTDYKTFCGGIYFFTAEQYADAMRSYVESRRKSGVDVRFIICSDATQHVEAFSGLAVSIHQGNSVSALYTLSRCSSIIGTDSSFARVAAFLGDSKLYQMLDSSLPVSEASFSKLDVLHAVKW